MLNTTPPQLIPAKLSHLSLLMSWFPDQESAQRWGGPHIQFPFQPAQFIRDIQWNDWCSYALVDEQAQLLAFGQVVERINRHHLGRLAVAPQQRGKGLGQRLIEDLIDAAQEKCPRQEASLLVYRDNWPAWYCYQKLGFTEAPYPPGTKQHANVAFMVKTLEHCED